MSENLKVNANSSVLEHKRKHNLLVDAVPQKDTDGNYKIFENIIDKDGHARFIEGSFTPHETTGFTFNYCKWALSGTHLLIVLAGVVANETAFDGATLTEIDLPQWIKNKIVNIYGNVVDQKGVGLFADDGTSQTFYAYLQKRVNDVIAIYCSSLTLTKERQFRIAFDLLIDNEEPETQGE